MSIKPELLAGIGDKIQATLADPGSIEFFIYALTQPAIIEATIRYDPQHNPHRSRNLEWLVEYITNSRASYGSIAREYNFRTGKRIFRQRVGQVIPKTVTRLHIFCPPEIQENSPLSALSLAKISPVKPLTPGQEAFNHTLEQATNLQQSLANFNANYTDQDVQSLLNQVDKSFYGYYSSDKPGRTRLLIAPRQLAFQRTDYFVAGTEMFLFYRTIEEAGIPMGKTEYRVSGGEKAGIVQRYHFIWTPHQERVLEAWAANEDLDYFLTPANPVRIFSRASWNNPMPTARDLNDESRFQLTTRLLEELGIDQETVSQLRKKGIFYRNNDLPIFYRYGLKLYYLVGQEKELEQYIRDFMKSSISLEDTYLN